MWAVFSSSILGNLVGFLGIPPPPWISGIIKLGVKRQVIYGLQQLAGKILSHLGLGSRISISFEIAIFIFHGFRNVILQRFLFCAQGQMSHRAVDFFCGHFVETSSPSFSYNR